jgi:hypothetical protein
MEENEFDYTTEELNLLKTFRGRSKRNEIVLLNIDNYIEITWDKRNYGWLYEIETETNTGEEVYIAFHLDDERNHIFTSIEFRWNDMPTLNIKYESESKLFKQLIEYSDNKSHKLVIIYLMGILIGILNEKFN